MGATAAKTIWSHSLQFLELLGCGATAVVTGTGTWYSAKWSLSSAKASSENEESEN